MLPLSQSFPCHFHSVYSWLLSLSLFLGAFNQCFPGSFLYIFYFFIVNMFLVALIKLLVPGHSYSLCSLLLSIFLFTAPLPQSFPWRFLLIYSWLLSIIIFMDALYLSFPGSYRSVWCWSLLLYLSLLLAALPQSVTGGSPSVGFRLLSLSLLLADLL